MEVVTGQPLVELLQERIFDPLGRVDSGFYIPAEKVDRLSHLYLPEGGFAPEWSIEVSSFGAAGGYRLRFFLSRKGRYFSRRGAEDN